MTHKFVGKLIEKVGERTWVSQRTGAQGRTAMFLVDSQERYAQKILLDVTDGAVGKIAQWEALIGKRVDVTFTVEASMSNGRWFNNVRGLFIHEQEAARDDEMPKAAQGEKAAEVQQEVQQTAPATPAEVQLTDEEMAGLPF